MDIPIQKGKRRFINTLSPNTSDVNIDQFQKVMKRVNNCNTSAWKCQACHLPVYKRCYGKAVHEIQMMALAKYKDDPRWRKEQNRIDNEKTIEKIKNRL